MVNPPQASILSLKNMATRFGTKTVHENLNLEVYAGEVLALVGGSGCGKSVLLRSLIGLEIPDEGSCTFHGTDLFTLDESGWVPYRRQIAYAFQWGALFDSLSVEENLAYPLQEHTSLSSKDIHERVHKTLSLFNLENTGKLLPGSLSGGMQKRVGVARSIMMEPEIVLYDEPTAGLDPSNTRTINDMILKLKSMGKTSVLVTHDMHSVMRVADRVAYLYQGKISALQTVSEIRQQPDPLIWSFMNGEQT